MRINKTLISFYLLLPSLSYAQNLPLDSLFALTNKNYCYQISQGKYQNIADYFGFNDNSIPIVANSIAQSVSMNYPSVRMVNNGTEMALELTQKYPDKYPAKEVSLVKLKNTYAVSNTIDLLFKESPGELMNKITNAYPGLVIKSEKLAGGYTFQQNNKINFSNVKNIKEFNAEYEKYIMAGFSFEVAGLKGEHQGSSVLSYNCTVNMVSGETQENLLNLFKAKK